jgi:hypothetical protein
MAARINLGMIRYRHEIIRALIAEGHSVSAGNYLEVLGEDDQAQETDQIKDDLTESRDKIYQEHCEAVSIAPTPDDKRYEALTKKKTRTTQELKELRKGELSRRYSDELITTELVQLDDKGEYPKARLHYYLTIGREFLLDRDKQAMERQLHSGEGELFLPDVNRSLMGGKIKFLEALNINSLLEQDTEWSNDSQVLIDLSIKSRQFAESIKSVLGVTIKEEDSPVAIAQKILRQSLGLAFSTPIKRGAKGNQQRYYQPVEIPELRQRTLEVWRQRDEAAKASQQATAPTSPLITASEDMGANSVILSLDSDVEVGSTGNTYISPVLPTESAAYQDEAVGSELEQLVEALPFCESAEDFALVVEGSPLETVNEAILMSSDQPRAKQLEAWLEALQKPSEPSLGFKVGDCLKRIKGVFEGQIARITEVLEWGIETSLGTVAFSEISGWELSRNAN